MEARLPRPPVASWRPAYLEVVRQTAPWRAGHRGGQVAARPVRLASAHHETNKVSTVGEAPLPFRAAGPRPRLRRAALVCRVDAPPLNFPIVFPLRPVLTSRPDCA